MHYGSYPHIRLRRLRASSFSARLTAETALSVDKLIYPVFITAKADYEPISSMPGISRIPINKLAFELGAIAKLGIPAVLLFPVVEQQLKSLDANEALNPDGLMPKAIQCCKENFPELGVMVDVALDPYTLSGHDGLIDDNGYVLNDETIHIITKQALLYSQCGADVIAPSEMMDGRIQAIRTCLEQHKFFNTLIMSYAVKYASSLYGPFRGAVNSQSSFAGKSKLQYQMAPTNSREALLEAALDVAEGADILLIKPALAYLDIIAKLRQEFWQPLACYQVSGEYAMLKLASLQGLVEEKAAVLESLYSMRRAGADMIISYYAKEVASWLKA